MLSDHLSIYLAEPFPTRGLLSATMSLTGFCSPHTAASRYPNSKSLSRISSSAGSNAQLKSCEKLAKRIQRFIHEGNNQHLQSYGITSLPVALFSGLQSGLIPIPCNPNWLAGKAQTRTCKDKSAIITPSGVSLYNHHCLVLGPVEKDTTTFDLSQSQKTSIPQFNATVKHRINKSNNTTYKRRPISSL